MAWKHKPYSNHQTCMDHSAFCTKHQYVPYSVVYQSQCSLMQFFWLLLYRWPVLDLLHTFSSGIRHHNTHIL